MLPLTRDHLPSLLKRLLFFITVCVGGADAMQAQTTVVLGDHPRQHILSYGEISSFEDTSGAFTITDVSRAGFGGFLPGRVFIPKNYRTTSNVLRQRAYPDYPTHGQVQASQITLDLILDERARELVAEENRRMTLVRTGTLVERAQNYLNAYNTAAGQPVTGLSNVTTRNGLLPIPQSAIDLNKGAVLAQNPGY